MKKKLVFILAALICLLPSLVAYKSYQNTLAAPVDEKTAVTISIDDINGRNTTLTKEEEGDTADWLIDFFLNMKKNAQEISALPDSLMGEKCFNVTISTAVSSDSYEYYFTSDPEACYLKASDGTAYKLNAEDAEMFITTEYAESVYDESSMPVLLLSQTYKVVPDSAAWKYINYTGEYVDADAASVSSDDVEAYELEGGLDLSFDMNPDFCSVKITSEDGTVLYDDMLTGLSSFRLSSTEKVTIEVISKWYEDPTRTFCGELDYKFEAYVTAPAEFYAGVSTIDAGKFIAVTAYNVASPSKIEMTSTMEKTYAPTFYSVGNNRAVAIIPIDIDTSAGQHILTFTYGGTTQNIVLTVENDGAKSSYLSIEQSMIDTYLTDSALAEFDKICAEIMAEGSSTMYFDGSFSEGVPTDATLLRGFGRYVYVNNEEDPSYRTNGVDYSASEGSSITACNNGVVVYTGNIAYCGNIVVVEHGFGLKTWYWNLGSVSVSVGDKVAKGDALGTAGLTGFASDTGAHIAMSAGTVFVSPYDTWADSSVAGKVIIAALN